jgi:hypothetical protein
MQIAQKDLEIGQMNLWYELKNCNEGDLRWVGLNEGVLQSRQQKVDEFLRTLWYQLRRYERNRRGFGHDVFCAGKLLVGHVDATRRIVFDLHFAHDRLECAVDALRFFKDCAEQAKIEVECWLMVAKRMMVIKDVRGMIAVMIWEARREGNWFASVALLYVRKQEKEDTRAKQVVVFDQDSFSLFE